MSGWTHCESCGAGYDGRKVGHECLSGLRAEVERLRAVLLTISETEPCPCPCCGDHEAVTRAKTALAADP